jgi:hypothetical protein
LPNCRQTDKRWNLSIIESNESIIPVGRAKAGRQNDEHSINHRWVRFSVQLLCCESWFRTLHWGQSGLESSPLNTTKRFPEVSPGAAGTVPSPVGTAECSPSSGKSRAIRVVPENPGRQTADLSTTLRAGPGNNWMFRPKSQSKPRLRTHISRKERTRYGAPLILRPRGSSGTRPISPVPGFMKIRRASALVVRDVRDFRYVFRGVSLRTGRDS